MMIYKVLLYSDSYLPVTVVGDRDQIGLEVAVEC